MVDMIYNRTSSDVDEAKRIRIEKVQKSIPLTEAEIETLNRGTVTIDTLNRIEAKEEELTILLNKNGYWNTPVETHTWTYADIFDINAFNRILNNLNLLRDAFFTFTTTPRTPTPRYHFSNFNDLEKILHDLEIMVDDIKSLYRECGAFECGQEEKFERLYR